MSCLHARGISDLPMGNGPGLQHTLPYPKSLFELDNRLIDSGLGIRLIWNQDMFTCIKPGDLKQCTPVGSTPLSVQAIGVIRFNLGSYVDCHSQRHPLDLEIPGLY